MSLPSTRILDHIVHLTPPGSVKETSEQFRKLGFKVIPGGRHTDKLTENALVVLQDGVYLELISFTRPASSYPPSSPERKARDAHPWAPKNPGWIDYAFLGSSGSHSISEIINKRAEEEGSGTHYLADEDGGRVRPDGRMLKWIITAPDVQHGRGTLPFFCGDVTPRDLRVPSNPPSNTEHPSTAQGIAYVRVLTDPDSLVSHSRQLTSVIGTLPVTSTLLETTWKLQPLGSSHQSHELILGVPEGDTEQQVLESNGPGIFEVAFWVDKKHPGGDVHTPYGKIVWFPLA